jgi:hypothetical protein
MSILLPTPSPRQNSPISTVLCQPYSSEKAALKKQRLYSGINFPEQSLSFFQYAASHLEKG